MKKNFCFLILLLFSFSALSLTKTKTDDEDMQFSVDLLKSLVLFFVDEELDSEVSEFIDYDFKHDVPVNAFVFLWGIDLVSDDPYADGLRLIQQVNAANDNYKHEWEPYDASFMDEFDSIKVKHEDFFCTFAESKCVDSILNASSERLEAARDNELILKRYKQFFKYSSFHPLHRSYFETPIPNYRYLSYGNQLALIEALERLENGDVDVFFELITDNVMNIRAKLSQAETLLCKMVLLSQLDWNIDVISQLILSDRIDKKDKRISALVKPLSQMEKDLSAALVYDLSNWVRLQQLLFENPHYLNRPSKKGIGSAIVNMVLPMAFKANLTLNIMYHQSIKPTLAFTTLSPKEFYDGYNTFQAEAKYPLIRGFLSNKLASYFTDNMKSYLLYPARMHAFDMGQQLIRAYHQEGSWELVIEKAQQGYQPYLNHYDQSPPFFDGEQICYDGVTDDTAQYRCIKIRSY